MGTSRHLSRCGTGGDDIAISDVMSRDVIAVGSDATIAELAELMIERCVSSAVIVDQRGRPCGVVTLSDLARALWTATIRPSRVGEIMTPFAFTLAERATVSRAAALMAYEGVHRIVVVGADGALAGVVSSVDVMRWIARRDGYVVPGGAVIERAEEDAAARASQPNVVLVIDDDSDMRDELAELLRDEGYQVVTAANGREALRALRRDVRPGLILLDLGMPVMDGRAFSAELRNDPALRDTPVVLLSGQGDARETAARLDARACLVKPVPYPTLLGTVERFCAA
jgi:CheY-like chemotaxis protein/predicted transcriptional regulator